MNGSKWPARYEVRVDSVLDDQWADWFGGLQLSSDGTQTVITGLFQVELGLQTALDLPVDPARKRTGEALDDLTDVIGKIRAIVSAARGQPAPPRAPRR